MAHETTTLAIDGFECDVDKAIAPLIEMMNNIPGINTFTCCEGYFDGSNDLFPLGYVSINVGNNKKETARVLRFLNLMFHEVSVRWLTRDNVNAEHDFHFQIECGDNFIMRWGEGMYEYVLDAAKAVAATMNTKPA